MEKWLHIICMNGDLKQLVKLITEEHIDLTERTVDVVSL